MGKVTATAPGRLDMMGGVGDYSGCLVLEVATHVATTVTAELVPGDDAVVMTSEPFGTASVPLAPLREATAAAGGHAAISLPAVAAFLKGRGDPLWAFYVYGSVAVFVRETGWLPPAGQALHLGVSSSVPTAQGVSSSASIEVAVIRALRALSGVALSELRTAHIAQNAENYVVGAPCGLMDQLASACGAPGKVLPILCRPDVLSPPVPLPDGVTLVGWPSGVKHSVAGVSPYLVARTATFMAKKIAEKLLGRTLAHAAELDPFTLHAVVAPALPEAMTGAEFTAAHGALEDALSSVQPERSYAIRAALVFPVEENFRCALARSLLTAAAAAPAGSEQYTACLSQVGELMALGHAAYTSIGLGAEETDAMVVKLRSELGPAKGVFGARVAGGGSGGTVVVLCEKAALPAVEALAKATVFDAPFTGLIQ